MNTTAITSIDLGDEERIFTIVMSSATDWIIRTHHFIFDVKQGVVSQRININNYGQIIDTVWGGNYALCVKHNYILLIGRYKVYAWDRAHYQFSTHEITNTLNKHPNFPYSDLRPFRASTDESDTITVLLQTQVAGDTPFWANLVVSRNLTFTWQTEHPNHLNPANFPKGIHHEAVAPDISDLARINNHTRIFTTGYHKAYGKYDMDFAQLTSGDQADTEPGKPTTFESAFGYFSADKKWLILHPLYSKGPTKGKPYVYHLLKEELVYLRLPRGCSTKRIVDIYNQTILLANDSRGKYPSYRVAPNEKLTLYKIDYDWG